MHPSKFSLQIAFIVLTALSIWLWNTPNFFWLLAPIKVFVTTLHETGHALVCLLTGGTVDGLTIVSDNEGHSGLTMCTGGNPLLYTPAGYLGTAVFGCALIVLSRWARSAKIVLILMGAFISIFSVILTLAAVFHGRIIEGAMSLCWALAIGLGLIWGGLRLSPSITNLLLLFLAIETALNSLTDVGYLIQISIGLIPSQSFSDATQMELITHLPAWLWSIAWGSIALIMLAFTLWYTYGGGIKERSSNFK